MTRPHLIPSGKLVFGTPILENGSNEFWKYTRLTSYGDQNVGVKKIPSSKFKLKEVENLIKCQEHPNVIKLFGYVCERHVPECWLVLEIAKCNLEELIVEADHADLKRQFSSKQILHDITKGIARLHFLKIKHRDLKPENILIIQDGVSTRAVVADFGHSKEQGEGLASALSGKVGSNVSRQFTVSTKYSFFFWNCNLGVESTGNR